MLAFILSLVGLGGGVGILTAILGPTAILAFLKPIGDFLAKIPWYVYVGLAIIGLIIFLYVSRSHWIARAHNDETQIAAFCSAARVADNNPKLDCSKAAAQVLLLGQAVKDTTAALGRQTAAINALAAQTAQEQQSLARARQTAAPRAADARSASARLDQSARSGPVRLPPPGTCEPSKALQEQWK